MEIPRIQQDITVHEGSKLSQIQELYETKTRLRFTERGKRAIATASVLIMGISIVSCEAGGSESDNINGEGFPPYQKYIDEYSGNREYELHIGDDNVLVLEDGAKFRPGHFIDDAPNYQEVRTDGDQALIKSEFYVTYHGDVDNGDWIGVPVESVNRDPVLDGFKDELLLGDGLLWVNAELASLELNESNETDS